MANILRMVIASGLKFPISKVTDYTMIPSNTFGVFVGIERSERHRLSKWPIDVHGCIGYWDSDYKNLDNNTIINKLIDVSFDATWNDKRRKYFRHTLYVDIYAKYKVYFMRNPIKKIDSNTGQIETTSEYFNNKKYGLIVENIKSKSQRATYLPDVFPDSEWNYIKKSLINKAAGHNETDFVFYAYECDIFYMILADYFIKPFQNFVNHNYKTFIPYMVNNNNIIVINKSEDVRNLATIYDILQMRKFGYNIEPSVINAINNNIEYYKQKYSRKKNSMRQASPFLVLDLSETNRLDSMINHILSDLNDQLVLQQRYDISDNPPNFEPIDKNFEQGEILMAMTKLNYISQPVINEIDKVVRDNTITNDTTDIFRYNWYSKLVNVKFMNPAFRNILLDRILKFIDTHNANETNFYAVEFEALCTIYPIVDDNTRLKMEPYIENLIIALENRRNANGLYEFTDGTMRIDITGHVMNGFYGLMLIRCTNSLCSNH